MAVDPGFKSALVWAAAVRLVLIVYGSFHDAWAQARGEVKYTDVDYTVFSDGAALVWNGRSPFERDTYRYTPLLALMLTPNEFVHPSFGKLLFAFCDLVVGALLHAILIQRHVPRAVARLCMATWLFNPLSINVSTRGNSESITAALLLASLLALVRRRAALAGALLAATMHMKPYPIIYLPAFAACLDGEYAAAACATAAALGRPSSPARTDTAPTGGTQGDEPPATAATVEAVGIGSLRLWLTGGGGALGRSVWASRLAFGASLVGVYASLSVLCTVWCGEAFWREALLYHLSREDPQHNFSPYWYPLSLTTPGSVARRLLALGAFVPQASLLLHLALRYGRDLPFCMCMQTLVFVSFNKVCTVQYFIWYHALLPLLLPSSACLRPTELPRTAAVLSSWVAALLLWLGIAYLLEFRHYPVHLVLWLASLAFLAANCVLLREGRRMHHATPLFRSGRLARQACLYTAAEKRRTPAS